MLVAVVVQFVGVRLAAVIVVPFAVESAEVAVAIQFVAAVVHFAVAFLALFVFQLGVDQFVDITDSAAVAVAAALTDVEVLVVVAVVQELAAAALAVE